MAGIYLYEQISGAEIVGFDRLLQLGVILILTIFTFRLSLPPHNIPNHGPAGRSRKAAALQRGT